MSICFAKVPIKINGDHEVKEYLNYEYSKLPKSKKQAQVTFNIHSESQESKDAIIKPDYDSINVDRVWFSKRAIFIDKRGFNPIGDVGYAIKLQEHPYLSLKSKPTLKVDVYCDTKAIPKTFRQKGKHWFEKQRDWNYLSRAEILAKNLIYDVIEPITHLRMLYNHCAFMHASGISDEENNAILFSGSGGVGKSNSCIGLILDGGWKFISDDLCIIDNKGTAYCYPKHLQIYAYNARAITELYNKLIKKRGLIDIVQWHRYEQFRGKDKVRRRMAPTELFGDDILSPNSKILKIIHLKSSNTSSFQRKIIEPEELARICKNVIKKEFESFFKYLITINEIEKLNPRLDEILKNSEEIYYQAFKKAECMVLGIKKSAKVPEILDYLKSKIL